jgi:hypothetical protein
MNQPATDKATKPKATKPIKTREQKANQAARIAKKAAETSQNPTKTKSSALRNEQRSIRARKLAKVYSGPPVVAMSRAQKDRMLRVRREIGVKSTSQSPNFGSKVKSDKPNYAVKQSRNQSGQNPRARVRSSATKLARKVGTERRLYQRRQVATQPTLFGGKDRVMSGPRFIGTRMAGGGKSRKPEKPTWRLPAPGSPRAKRYRADTQAAYRELGAAGLFSTARRR